MGYGEVGMKTEKKSQAVIYALPFILVLVSLGCDLSSGLGGSSAEAQFAPTRTPMPTFTPTTVGAAFIEVPTVSALPTEAPSTVAVIAPESVIPSPTPEPPATPTPNNDVTVTVLQDMNVRGGPGTNYPVVGSGKAGQSTKVVGRNADSSWLQVEFPSPSGTGWVYTELVQVSGNPEAVAIAQAPPPPAAPPPAAAPPSQPEQQPEQEAPPPAPKYQFTPTGWHASKNAAIVQFKGRIKDEGGGLVNGFSVLADNGAFRVLSHPAGASQWYPDKGDGEWDIVMPRIHDAQGWWWLTVVIYQCNFAGGFDAQCQQYTKLSEDVKIEVRTPEESIINADWVCHWDCDKGLYKDGFRRP
jgi:uncharacterized protein YraI